MRETSCDPLNFKALMLEGNPNIPIQSQTTSRHDHSCKCDANQYNSLTFVAGLKRATDEGLLPEIAQYTIASKGSNLYIYSWFVINRDNQGFCYSKECRFNHLFSGLTRSGHIRDHLVFLKETKRTP